MTLIMVVFIVLSLAGSVMWVLPSKQDRDRMALRLQARKLKLNVQLTSIDLPDKWDKVKEPHKVAAYAHYRIKPLLTLSDSIWLLPYEVWKYQTVVDSWWVSRQIEVGQEVKDILSQYGFLINAIQVAPEGVTVYWQEEGDMDSLEKMAVLIDRLSLVDIG